MFQMAVEESRPPFGIRISTLSSAYIFITLIPPLAYLKAIQNLIKVLVSSAAIADNEIVKAPGQAFWLLLRDPHISLARYAQAPKTILLSVAREKIQAPRTASPSLPHRHMEAKI